MVLSDLFYAYQLHSPGFVEGDHQFVGRIFIKYDFLYCFNLWHFDIQYSLCAYIASHV